MTGSTDGAITVWNQLSGVRKFAFTLPRPRQTDGKAFPDDYDTHALVKISQLMLHPLYGNLVTVLQESGNAHIFDLSTGTLVAEYVAFLKVNSVWACDDKWRFLCIGDCGDAAFFDSRTRKGMSESLKKFIVLKAGFKPAWKDGQLKNFRWKQTCSWFDAHSVGIHDGEYVHSCTYIPQVDLFASATSFGEVKLWKN